MHLENPKRKEWEMYDPVYGLIGRTRGPWWTTTAEGFLVSWERGNTRYTLGWRWRVRRRPHFVRWPMTDLEVTRRELA